MYTDWAEMFRSCLSSLRQASASPAPEAVEIVEADFHSVYVGGMTIDSLECTDGVASTFTPIWEAVLRGFNRLLVNIKPDRGAPVVILDYCKEDLHFDFN